MSSVIAALAESGGPIMDIVDYSEHAIGQGSNVQAAAYVECRTADGKSLFGCGLDTDVATASVRAILSAATGAWFVQVNIRSEEPTSEIQSLMRTPYAVS